MRDNGLTAAAYVSMGDIDPLIAEPVLAALAEAGIAAYAASPGEEQPDGAEVTGERPAEPGPESAASEAAAAAATPGTAGLRPGREEIFVDAGFADSARAVIRSSTEEAEWKALVEQFNAPPAPGRGDSPVPRWPVSEDIDTAGDGPVAAESGRFDQDPDPDTDTDTGEAEEAAGRRARDPHDHFVPPEPPRGPRLDWISRAAWLGLIGGPLLIVLAAVFDFGQSRVTLLAVVGFVGGFLTLVFRMKDRLPTDDTGDDGAVV